MSENKMTLIKALSVSLFIGLIFTNISCKKDNNTMVNYDYGVVVTTDYASVQHLNISIVSTYFKAIYDTVLMNTGISNIDGALIEYSPDSLFQLKIIYPDWGNDDGYGNLRQGEINITANGGFFSVDENAKFYFNNFYFTKDTITADLFEIKYIGREESNEKFQIITDNEKRHFVDSTGSIVFSSIQNYTVTFNDTDQYKPENLLISGSLNGISRNDGLFQSTSKVDLLSDFECNWMKQGEIEILIDESEFDGTVFFSNPEECENWYNLVLDGIDFPSAIEKPKSQ